MKIVRYVAKDMRQALNQVREQQGPDAVILSTRQVGDHVEVVAAMDYDPEIFAAGSFDAKETHGAPTRSAVKPQSSPAQSKAAQQVRAEEQHDFSQHMNRAAAAQSSVGAEMSNELNA